jgi:hypothetical protein
MDLDERSERCACMPNVAGLSHSSGSESTFCSDLLLTVRGTCSMKITVSNTSKVSMLASLRLSIEYRMS